MAVVKGSRTFANANLASGLCSEGHFPFITSHELFTQTCRLLHKVGQGVIQGLARWPLLQNWEYLDDSFSVKSVFITVLFNHLSQRLTFPLSDGSD